MTSRDYCVTACEMLKAIEPSYPDSAYIKDAYILLDCIAEKLSEKDVDFRYSHQIEHCLFGDELLYHFNRVHYKHYVEFAETQLPPMTDQEMKDYYKGRYDDMPRAGYIQVVVQSILTPIFNAIAYSVRD